MLLLHRLMDVVCASAAPPHGGAVVACRGAPSSEIRICSTTGTSVNVTVILLRSASSSTLAAKVILLRSTSWRLSPGRRWSAADTTMLALREGSVHNHTGESACGVLHNTAVQSGAV